MTNSVSGILPAAITPRRGGEPKIDVVAALELFEFLESKGVDGITLLGSTGEFPHFDIEDRMFFAASALKQCRVPVLVNVSHSTLDGAVALGRQAARAGAAGVLVMPPYYFRYSQESIHAYCMEFAAQVKAPIFLYNIPQFTTEIKLPTALDLLSTGAFAGIKDSSGDWDSFAALQHAAPSVLVGADAMYSRAKRAGARGAISGVASAVPELMVAIERCVKAGEDTSALDARVAEFVSRSSAFPFPLAIREAASMRGVKTGPHASPLGRQECLELEKFRSWFTEWLNGAITV